MELNLNYIKIIAGLGNPGVNYQNTYHNVGMLCLKYIIRKVVPPPLQFFYVQKNFKYIKFKINSKIIYFVIPMVFMNNSGIAIKEALKKFKTSPNQLLVIQDDSDLEIGNFKYSFRSESAGHKGIKSIFEQIKSKEFWRLRIGIRPPNKKKLKAENIVLKKINLKDKKIFHFIFEGFIAKLTEKVKPSS